MGEVAILVSHRRALRRFLQDEGGALQSVLIFEDDFTPTTDVISLHARLSNSLQHLPADWKVLFLGAPPPTTAAPATAAVALRLGCLLCLAAPGLSSLSRVSAGSLLASLRAGRCWALCAHEVRVGGDLFAVYSGQCGHSYAVSRAGAHAQCASSCAST
eukprot:scaffold2775_cov343-Prasinococcus_capsulatus_cf.AAC.4